MLFVILLYIIGLLSIRIHTLPIEDDYVFKPNSITKEGLMKHLYALDKIGKENGGNRFVGTKGHQDTLQYIQKVINSTNQFDVQLQDVKIQTTKVLVSTLKIFSEKGKVNEFIVTPLGAAPNTPKGGVDTTFIRVLNGTGCSNDTTTTTSPLNSSSNKKQPWIALVQRGECTFTAKQLNAYQLGASAILIYNNVEGELRGELDAQDAYIPTGGLSKIFGETLVDLVSKKSSNMYQLRIETKSTMITSQNIIAETKAGNKTNVITIGGHSDSVEEGPGINDDGSGTSAILELALNINQNNIKNAIRFCWWTGEELGLLGSTAYVNSLTKEELKKIALYLNIDMIASPNYVNYIYDGDQSNSPKSDPPAKGTADIEKVFEDYFKSKKQNYQPLDLAIMARSDAGPFYTAGVPFGGLSSGFEYIKTEEEVKLYGGKAGVAHDACYHKACDTIQNINTEVFELQARGYSYALSIYSKSTSSLYTN
ncbi:unnamed protein product [Cunninghamella blakesleeana]